MKPSVTRTKKKTACWYQKFCDYINSDSCFFLQSLITGDESWVYGYDPEKKTQSSH
jgi:hypothetical protein